MTTKLIYIYDTTGETYQEDRRRAESRVGIAQSLGMEVLAIDNRGHKSDDLLYELETEIAEAAGLWVDVSTLDMGLSTKRLIGVAQEAGKKVIGKILPEEAIQEALGAYFSETPPTMEGATP